MSSIVLFLFFIRKCIPTSIRSSPWPWNLFWCCAIQKVGLDSLVEVIKDQHQKSRDFVNLFFQNHLLCDARCWCHHTLPPPSTSPSVGSFTLPDLNSWYTFESPRAKSDLGEKDSATFLRHIKWVETLLLYSVPVLGILRNNGISLIIAIFGLKIVYN